MPDQLKLRTIAGTALTNNEVDINFSSLFYSASMSGSFIVFSTTGSDTKLATSTAINVGLGYLTNASGQFSHAEGTATTSSGSYSHAEGTSTLASGISSHAEGYYTTSSGDYSHAEGYNTIASGSYQHVQGQYNISSSVQSAFIHGNGTSDAARSNLIYAHDSVVEITGSLLVTGSVNISTLQLISRTTTPTFTSANAGTLFVSGAISTTGSLFFYDGANIRKLV